MFIDPSTPNPSGAVWRSGTQVYRYHPSSFRSSKRRMVVVVLGSINISLLRSEEHAENTKTFKLELHRIKTEGTVQ